MDDYTSFPANCLSHMAKNGFRLESPLRIDGKFHRFSIDENEKKKDEWYVVNEWLFKGKTYFHCSYGSWSKQEIVYRYPSWAKKDKPFRSRKEKEEFYQSVNAQREKILKELRKNQNLAAETAQKFWDRAFLEPQNEKQEAYLKLKKIQAHHARFGKNPYGDDSLILPIRNIEGQLRSLQFINIDEEGDVRKYFLEGGEKKGCFSVIGNLTDEPIKVYVAEGFSTSATVYEAQTIPTLTAFDCGSLDSVIENFRKKNPFTEIVIARDDDVETAGNPGQTKAEAAAKKHRCRVVSPQFPEGFRLPPNKKGERKRPTDWNDLQVYFGVGEVRKQLNDTETNMEQKQQGFHFRQAHSLTQEPPRIDWLIKPYLDMGSLGVIFGEPGSMKTFLAIDMGLCVATGRDWHGAPVRNTGSVFYIAGEGFNGFSRRLLAWSQFNKIDLQKIPFFLSNRSVEILTDESIKEVIHSIEMLKKEHGNPALIIIDTLNRNFGPGDENKTEDMTTFVRQIDTFIKSAYNCAVLIIHHSPIDKSNRARGASSLKGALDWEYLLKKNRDGNITLSSTKEKDFGSPPIIHFKCKVVLLEGCVDPRDAEVMSSCVLERVSKDSADNIRDKEQLQKVQKIVFECLLHLHGSGDYDQTLGVPLNIWRKRAYAKGITSGGSPDAKLKAFNRAVISLEKYFFVKSNNDDCYVPYRTTDTDKTTDGHVCA